MLYLFLLAPFYVWIFVRIAGKAGFSPWLGLLSIIPLANFVWLLHLAWAEWPIERKLRRAGDFDVPPPADVMTVMFRRAENFERLGNFQEALKLFETLAEELGGQPGTRVAQRCAERLRARLQANRTGAVVQDPRTT